MKRILTLAFLALLAQAAWAQNSFTEKFNQTNRSTRVDFRIELTDTENNSTYVPISIIKGKENGPVFTILAGVHGFEYPPIIAVQELMQEIKADQLSGTLVILPITNTASFFGRSPFVNPQDNVNLNRAFPGSPDGQITKRIADLITNAIIPVSDVFLDIHGGDANEDLQPFVCYYNNLERPEQTGLAKRLSENSGLPYVVEYPYTLKADAPAKYAFKQAVQDGKTALSIESGGLGNVQKEAVELIKDGVYNMLDELKMYVSPVTNKGQPISLNQQVYIKARSQGLFFSTIKAGDRITKGQIVGHIKDEFGNLLSEIAAPNSGIVLYKIGTPPVNLDETLMCIGFE